MLDDIHLITHWAILRIADFEGHLEFLSPDERCNKSIKLR